MKTTIQESLRVVLATTSILMAALVDAKEVHLDQPGDLAKLLGEEAHTVESLKVSGIIGAEDFEILCDATFNGQLEEIDLGEALLYNGTIPAYAFLNGSMDAPTKLRKFICPWNTLVIGEGAFQSASNLEEIVFDNNLQYIRKGAFAYCSDLKIDIWPESLRWIGNSAFLLCESMETVYITRNVEHLGTLAFSGLAGLKEIFSSAPSAPLCGELYEFGLTAPEKVFGGDTQPATSKDAVLYIPRGSTESYAKWSYFNNIVTTIDFPNAVSPIVEGTYPEAVPEGFSGKTAYIETPGTLATLLGEELNTIESLAISGLLNEKDFETLWKGTFHGRLEEIDLSCAYVVDGIIPDNAFWKEYVQTDDDSYTPVKLRRFLFPRNTVRIGENAFTHADYLTEVTVSDATIYILDAAFADCRSIESVSLPSTLRFIGTSAFGNLPLLQWICSKATFPPMCDVEHVNGAEGHFDENGEWVYDNMWMDGIHDFIVDTTFGNYVTSTTPHSAQLFVPVGAEEDYSKSYGWDYFSDIIGTNDFPSSGVTPVLPAPFSPDDRIYDLYGRRITDPQPGTIYIRNGRKYIER